MSVLLVSDSNLVGDVGEFVRDHGYDSYYGPIGRSEVVQELLDALPGVDIFWLEVSGLGEEVVLEEYKNPKYGERRMWLVKPLGINQIPDDLMLHVLLPMVDLETLGTLSHVSAGMFDLVSRRVFSMSKELEEIKWDEFRHLVSECGEDLEAAYDTWSLYNRIVGVDVERLDILLQGCVLEVYEERVTEIRHEISQLGSRISHLSIPWLERVFDTYFTVDRFRCDGKCQRVLVGWILDHLSDKNIVLIWEAMDSGWMKLEYPQNLEGVDSAIEMMIRQLFEFIPFGLRGITLSAIIQKQRPELLEKITYEDYELAVHGYLTSPVI